MLNMISVRRIAVFFAFLLVGPSPAFSCMCVPPPKDKTMREWIKEKVERADVIFVGTVESLPTGNEPEDDDDLVSFRDVEVLKGEPATTLKIHSGIGTRSVSSCGYPFGLGEAYVVFAHRFDGHLSTGLCSLTGLKSRSDAVLRFLRRAPSHPEDFLLVEEHEAKVLAESTGDVCGTITRADGGRLEDAEVIVFDENGLQQTYPAWLSGLEKGDGIYRLPHLEPGHYRISVVSAPRGNLRWAGNFGNTKTLRDAPGVQVVGGGETCGIDVTLYPLTTYSLVGEFRKPEDAQLKMKDLYMVVHDKDETLFPVTEHGIAREPHGFTVRGLPAGVYAVYVRIEEEDGSVWVNEDFTVEVQANVEGLVIPVKLQEPDRKQEER